MTAAPPYLPPLEERLLRPQTADPARLLLIARSVPLAPDYAPRPFPGDGGYPAYYHRVWQTLSALGYPVATSDQPLAVLAAAGATDLVFSLYNRLPISHPEVLIPSLCSYAGLPCLGAPPNVRALAEDKWFTKLSLGAAGLPVSPGAVYADVASLTRPPAFPGPYFVKHRYGAASEGISADSIQDDWTGAARVARTLLESRGMTVLVEQYAPGIDLTVPVLGGTPPLVLGVVQPRSDRPGSIITEDLKRDDPLGYALVDPGPAAGAAFLEDVARLVGVTGPVMDYWRLDYRFDPASGKRTFLEFNLCCHIGRSGAICLAASSWGLGQAEVLGHVVEYSLQRQRVRAGG